MKWPEMDVPLASSQFYNGKPITVSIVTEYITFIAGGCSWFLNPEPVSMYLTRFLYNASLSRK